MSDHQQISIVNDTSNPESDPMAQALAAEAAAEAAIKQPAATPDRPAWLPEKFKSPTDMAQAYGVAQNMRQDGYAAQGKVEAGKAADNATNTAAISAAGSVVGGIYGGPAGAAAGGAAGNAVGSAAAEPTNSAYDEQAKKGIAQHMRPA
jgi:hypothetical protein